MPLVRLSLILGKSPAYIRSLGEGVHRALIETCGVPPDDRFQFVQQYEAEAFGYDANYLGASRTDDLVVIEILLSNWRSVAQKQALYRAIADNLARDPGLRPDDILIALAPNDRSDWSFGHGVASYVSDAGDDRQDANRRPLIGA